MLMHVWERKVYKLYKRLNTIKLNKKQYDCEIHFPTNPEDWYRLNNYERDKNNDLIMKDYLGQFTPFQTKIQPKRKKYKTDDYLPTYLYNLIIKDEPFILYNGKQKGYLYNPSTLKEYSFIRLGIKNFEQHNTLKEFIKSVQSTLALNYIFLPSKRWHLKNTGKIETFRPVTLL